MYTLAFALQPRKTKKKTKKKPTPTKKKKKTPPLLHQTTLRAVQTHPSQLNV
jgi:hypothetical protein